MPDQSEASLRTPLGGCPGVREVSGAVDWTRGSSGASLRAPLGGCPGVRVGGCSLQLSKALPACWLGVPPPQLSYALDYRRPGESVRSEPVSTYMLRMHRSTAACGQNRRRLRRPPPTAASRLFAPPARKPAHRLLVGVAAAAAALATIPWQTAPREPHSRGHHAHRPQPHPRAGVHRRAAAAALDTPCAPLGCRYCSCRRHHRHHHCYGCHNHCHRRRCRPIGGCAP
mmetsp:Transcript_69293/g.207954  ORF Transcript_69293/g.207954 Transcript_69293/m.207954 type:complete len:228 (+) Transcript_69293:222-905(+)